MKRSLLVCALLSGVLVSGLVLAGAVEAQDSKPQENSGVQAKDGPAEYPDTYVDFGAEAGSADAKMQQLMTELRKIKRTPLSAISPAEREKAWKTGMSNLADEIDARLKKDNLWGADGGLQSTGMSSYLRGDYEVAILLFTKAIEKATDPNVKTWVIKDRGEAYFAKGDRENALKDLDAAIKMKAENKGYNFAQFALKLGRVDDAQRELEIAAAYQKAKIPGFVATWGVCSDLEGLGRPAAGCITSAISECFSLYGTETFGKSDCGKYEPEMKYLASRPPGALDNMVKIKNVTP